MRKKNPVIYSLVLFFCLFFSLGILSNALAESKYKDYPVPKETMDQVRKEGSKLIIYNWAEWWPKELFKNFTKEFGVKIVQDNFADTEEMATKLKLNPKAPYDLVLGAGPTNVIQLRAMGLIQELNHDWLPNVGAYMMDEYKNMPFDPGNRHQLPDFSYSTLFAYNSEYVDMNDPLIGSWKFLFENEKYAGKITMLDNMYEAIGAALKYLGYSWNSDDEGELMQAKEVLLKQKPRLVAYDSWPRRLVVEKEAWVSQTWVGDAWFLHVDVPSIKAILPSEGTYIATDTAFIPIGSKHPATAHLFLNYIFRTEVNALLVGHVGYPPVHKHTMEFLTPEMKAWPGFVISEEYLKKSNGVEERAIVGKGKELRIKIWEEVKK